MPFHIFSPSSLHFTHPLQRKHRIRNAPKTNGPKASNRHFLIKICLITESLVIYQDSVDQTQPYIYKHLRSSPYPPHRLSYLYNITCQTINPYSISNRKLFLILPRSLHTHLSSDVLHDHKSSSKYQQHQPYYCTRIGITFPHILIIHRQSSCHHLFL